MYLEVYNIVVQIILDEIIMWIILALCAACFTSLTNIFAKIGISKEVNSNLATAYRTFVVIICSVIICFISGDIYKFGSFTYKNYIFLILSSIFTCASWICYYKAIQLGNVSKVAAIDKSSFILTSILFIIFFYNDTTNGGNRLALASLIISIIFIFIGTYLIIDQKRDMANKGNKWLIYAILSAVFASFVSLFIKLGLKDTPSDLGTLFRTIIVFIFASLIVVFRKDYRDFQKITCRSWIFLTISGVMTGGAWLLEYSALNYVNSNPVGVSSIGKLSILLTMSFSYLILKEKFSRKMITGLYIICLGIFLVITSSL